MTRLEIMTGLELAWTLLKSKKDETVFGSNAVWAKLHRAQQAIDKQLADLLAE